MIRVPVLPQARARLWTLVRSRLEVIEAGLELVVESLDCSEGRCGPIESLCRDASGAPVLLALALEDDVTLLPRVLAADEFLDRVGSGLADAVPEGSFRPGVPSRLVVVGSKTSAGTLATLARLGLPRLERCRLEPFRLGGSERFAVRWLEGAAVAPGDREPPPVAAASSCGPQADAGAPMGVDEALWQAVVGLCRRLDPAVELDGGRFRRRILWHGRTLGQLTSRDGALRASTTDGAEFAIENKADVRAFGDRLLRRFAEMAGLTGGAASEPADRHVGAPVAEECAMDRGALRQAPPRDSAPPAPRLAGTLRSALAEALLSPEEFAALTRPEEVARPNDSPE